MSTPGAGPSPHVQAVYLVTDTSGSTVRGGFASACMQALPLLVDAAGQQPGRRFSLIAYGTEASVLVRLSAPAEISLIPPLTPGGLSSLLAGLRLLAQCLNEDARQLTADGIGWQAPVAVVLADGLPTDPDADLLAARDTLDAGQPGPPPALHAAMPDGTDRLAVAGLRMTFHPLPPGSPASTAAAILAAFRAALGG